MCANHIQAIKDYFGYCYHYMIFLISLDTTLQGQEKGTREGSDRY